MAGQLRIAVSLMGQQQIAGVNGFGLESWFLVLAFLPGKSHTPKSMFPTGVGVCRNLQCFILFMQVGCFQQEEKDSRLIGGRSHNGRMWCFFLH